MIGTELKTMTETILDQTVDDDLFYQLLNNEKNIIEDARPWMFLRALDSSQTATTGNNATTSRALPTSWRRTYKLMIGEDMEYTQIPFDQQHLYRNHSRLFVVDVANNVYYLLGNIGRADTIYHYYIKSTPDITSSTEPVWPSRFHPYLAFRVAGYIMVGQDADDIFARMAPENKNLASEIWNSMQLWDTNLQLAAQGNRIQVEGERQPLDIGLL